MNLEKMSEDEERFLYIGDELGSYILKIIFKYIDNSIVAYAVNNNIETLIGTVQSNKVLIAFSGSCLISNDAVYLYEYNYKS